MGWAGKRLVGDLELTRAQGFQQPTKNHRVRFFSFWAADPFLRIIRGKNESLIPRLTDHQGCGNMSRYLWVRVWDLDGPRAELGKVPVVFVSHHKLCARAGQNVRPTQNA